MIIRANSWARSSSPPTPPGITASISAVSFSGTICPSYTDGLSLFGHDSMADDRDPCSEFQRAFSALGVTHLVAPSPQAKGKIERRFGTLQKRLVALLADEKLRSYAAAQIVLNRELQRQNATLCRTTGLSPNAAWKKARIEKRTATRPCPPATHPT